MEMIELGKAHQKEYMEKFLFITDYISNHFF